MDRICFYFTRLTVFEEGTYLRVSPELARSFLSDGLRIAEIRDICEAYNRVLQVDLFDEYRSPGVVSNDKRTFETGIYAAFAYFLEKVAGIEPSCLAFYSSGVTAALIHSQIVSMQQYLERILPFNVRVRECYAEAGRRNRLAQVRLEGEIEDDVEGFVRDTLRGRELEARVFLKDRRHRHTTLIGGEAEGVMVVRDLACQRFHGVAKRSPRTRFNIGSAHLPFYDRAPLIRMLHQVSFAPPRFRIIGPAGSDIPPNCNSEDILRQLVIQSALDPLDTGQVVRTAATYADRFCVIGSPLGAHLLGRATIGNYPKPEMATAISCAGFGITPEVSLTSSRASPLGATECFE